MPLAVFEKVLDYPIGMEVVIGHMLGEAFLHPDLHKIVRLCQERGLAFGFSTNTLLLDLAELERLVDAGLSWLVISFHTPQAQVWVDAIKQAFPELPLITSQLEIKHDWAGQVHSKRAKNIQKPGDCIFHAYNFATITAQAEIFACCMDANGKSSLGSLFNYSPEEFALLNNDIWFDLCDQCPMRSEHVEDEYVAIENLAKQIHQYRQKFLSTKR